MTPDCRDFSFLFFPFLSFPSLSFLFFSCQAYLDQLLLKEQLNDFFEDGEQARVVHADAALEQRQQAVNELQLAVFFFEALHGLLEDQRHALLFLWGVEVELLVAHEQRALLTLPAVACWMVNHMGPSHEWMR